MACHESGSWASFNSPPEVTRMDSCTTLTVALHLRLELGGMTKNVYHGIFLNYTGFTVYDGIFFSHA